VSTEYNRESSEADVGTIREQQPLPNRAFTKCAKPLPFCGRIRRKGESKTRFQTSAVQRQRLP
jgi:hypothetical protein